MVLSSSPRTVVIRAQAGMSNALPLAEAECAKHGRHARYLTTGRAMTEIIFDCVQ